MTHSIGKINVCTDFDINRYRIDVITRTKFSSKLPKHNFPLIWNQIDTTIKAIPSKQIFKKTLMKLTNNTYLENVHCDNIRCIQCHDK